MCASAPVEVVGDALYMAQFGGCIHHGCGLPSCWLAWSIGRAIWHVLFFDHMHQLGCMSMLFRVEYVHGSIGLTHMSGYIRTIGVAASTPFTGGGGRCFACGWRWWMSGLVICVQLFLMNCIMKSQCWFLEVSGCGVGWVWMHRHYSVA